MESLATNAADTNECATGPEIVPHHPFGVLVPTLGGQPIDAVHPDVVGDALALISLKRFDDRLAVEQEMMAKRNSFRNLHRPEMSHLEWVKDSAADKKEAIVDKVLSFHTSRHSMNQVVYNPRLTDDGLPRGSTTEHQSPRRTSRQLTATLIGTQPPPRDEPREFMLRSTTLAPGEYAVEGGDTAARFVWPLERQDGEATSGGPQHEPGRTRNEVTGVSGRDETGSDQPRIGREKHESTESQHSVEIVDDPQDIIRNFVRLSHETTASATSDTDDLLMAAAQKLEPVAALRSTIQAATIEDGDFIDDEQLKIMSQRTSTAPIAPTNSANLIENEVGP